MKTHHYPNLIARASALAFAVLTSSVLLASGAAAVPGADMEFIRTVEYFENEPVFNYCTGETILETGSITIYRKTLTREDGSILFMMLYWFEATGIGEDLQIKYRINQQARQRIFRLSEEGGFFEISDRWVQISKGSEPNTQYLLSVRALVDAEGNLQMLFRDAHWDCIGPEDLPDAAE